MSFGPIDFIALEFAGNDFKGDILSDLTKLVSNETIRVLDLIIVKKDERGEYIARELQTTEPETLQMFNPLRAEISGLITVDDIKMIGERLQNNTSAAIMLFEHLWAVKLVQDIVAEHGRLVMLERIPREVIQEAVEDLSALA
jgi:uncharacterized membrane protein